MHIDAGERLRLTLWGAGGRAMVSVNAFPVTQPAFEGLDPSEDGFTYDVTRWLHAGCNTLTVVLIDAPRAAPFRMAVAQDGAATWTLDEADMLQTSAPWRLWSCTIDRAAMIEVSLLAATVEAANPVKPTGISTVLSAPVAHSSFTAC